MKPKEIIVVETERTACDGGDGPLGHPRVYLSLADRPAIECPYCGRQFQRSDGIRRDSVSQAAH